MPTIVSGIVLRWDVDREREPPVLRFREIKPVSVYREDDSDQSMDGSALISRYILDSDDGESKLLNAALNGLLQVVDIRRLNVEKPVVPSEYVSAVGKPGKKQKGSEPAARGEGQQNEPKPAAPGRKQ
jgi:hypothetical protein